MNNNIKEILDKLLKYFKESNKNDFGYEKDKLISYEEAQILLDYITNLQESEAYYYGYYKDYKSRIDKTIEYIKSNFDFQEIRTLGIDYEGTYEISLKVVDLLNILEGGNNE